jgi:proteasome lid subunit RPN8/RPN11
MFELLRPLLRSGLSALKRRRNLVIENLALRQQLAVLSHSKPRPRLSNADRMFWIALGRYWDDWRDHLVIVKPGG